jgi:NlpC/P60 family putative phage cell wall peptidase
MLARSDIVAAARSWVGTPFHWEASVKGVGCDCKGLIAGVAREIGRPEGDALEAHARAYSRRIDARELKSGLQRLFDRTDTPHAGDILLLHVAGKAQHMAIYAGDGRMIHTARGLNKVTEVPVGKSRPIDSIWTWRGLDG